MRLVFSSARIENAEAVAGLLRDEGIEVRLENGRGFRSSIRGNFSYRERDDAGPRAEVWVVRSDDQPRARQLLREAGLLEASPASLDSFLPSSGHAARMRTPSPVRRARLRLGLMIAAVIALALWLNQFRDPGWDLPEPAAAPVAEALLDPALQPVSTDAGTLYRIPTPPALAATLAALELADAPATTLCLTVDGEDAGEAALASARAAGLEPQPAAACAGSGDWLQVSIGDYRTDGSGAGTVALATTRAGSAARERRLEVRRDGNEWHRADTL